MQQEGVGGSQQQDRRLKLVPPENQQPLQPQKCPRCESLNTKFCYYNNYSLSQPRYFCKTCRRYWTQGGTLRNVPVGGGCRKGKRPKKPSPADDLQDQPPPPTRPQNQLDSVTTTSSTTLISTTSGPTLRKTETDLIMASSPMPPMVAAPSSFYYPSGGYLSSIAALQSFNPPMNVGGDFGGSNLALLQGFSLPTFNPQQQPQQFQQLLPAEENVIQARRPATTSYQEWNQGFVEATNSIKSEAGYWTSTSNNSNNTSGTSLNPNQWVGDLPGYVPPPLPPSSSSQSFL